MSFMRLWGAALLVQDDLEDLLVGFEHAVGDMEVLGDAQAVLVRAVVAGTEVSHVDARNGVVIGRGIEDVDDAV